MVMAVFTLPSYPLVFKLIRDRFAWPKAMSRQQVEESTRWCSISIVSCLLDAQPYRHLRFPRERFAPALLDELLQQCAQSVRIDGDEVEVALCYVQRRFRPLNLYLREQARRRCGRRCSTMRRRSPTWRATTSSPVTCCRRISAYHGMGGPYSTTTTSCAWSATACSAPGRSRVRRKAMADEPWFHVGPRDVFPERFGPFMGLPAAGWRPCASTTGTCSTRAGGRACRNASAEVTIRTRRPIRARTGWPEPAVLGAWAEVLSPIITRIRQ